MSASFPLAVSSARACVRQAAKTTLHQRPCLAIVAVAILSLTHKDSYSAKAMLGAGSALVLTLIACLGPDRKWQLSARWARVAYIAAGLVLQALSIYWATRGRIWQPLVGSTGAVLVLAAACTRSFQSPSMTAGVIAAATLILGSVAMFGPYLAYTEHAVFMTAVRLAAAAGLCVVVATMIAHDASKRAMRRLLFAALIAGGLMRFAVVQAAPHPVIDVYGWLHEAPDNVLHGTNPYSAAYANCYTTDLAKLRHVYHAQWDAHPAAYPPLPILLALPFRAAGWDPRAANICCGLVAALVLFLAARRRGDPFAGVCLATMYLNLPGVPYLTEQAWYEPMLAALMGGGLLLAEDGRWLGHVLIGLGITGKQFGVPLLFPLLRGLRQRWRRVLLVTMATGIAISLPFLVWDLRWFLDVVIWKHLERSTNFDGNNLFSLAHHLFGWDLPRYVAWSIAGMLIACIGLRTPRGEIGSALWVGTALLAFVLCNPVAYFNYFYLVQYLLLLGSAGLVSNAAVQSTRRPEPVGADRQAGLPQVA